MQIGVSPLSGAIQLMQMQEDMKKQLEEGDGNGEEAIERYLELKQKMMLDSLWKLNVADIELTLSHVCQQVLVPHQMFWLSSEPLLFKYFHHSTTLYCSLFGEKVVSISDRGVT